MTPELKQMAELLAKLQEQQGKTGPAAAAFEGFEDVLGDISTALSDIVGLMENKAKAYASRQKAEDARQTASHEAMAAALSNALKDAVGRLKVESKPDVKLAVANVTVPAITLPAMKAPAIEVPSANVTVKLDASGWPAPQVTLLPAPPAPTGVHTVRIERDHNGFIREMTITRTRAD